MKTITEQEKEVFDYLNELRESGETNMFGAGVYISDTFRLDKITSRALLSKWMKNFNKDGYDHIPVENK